MKFTFEAVMLSVKERQSKDGRNTYYDVNVDQDGDIVTMACTPEVAKLVGPNKYKPYVFTGQYSKGEYNGQVFTRFGVIDAHIATKG